MTEILIMNWIYRNRTAMKQLHRPIRNAAKQEVAVMLGRNADTFRKIALGTVAIATVLMSAAGAYAIEPFLQGFSAPVGIHAYGGTSLFGVELERWNGRAGAGGWQALGLPRQHRVAGRHCDRRDRAVFVSSHSGGIIVRVRPDRQRQTGADRLANPNRI